MRWQVIAGCLEAVPSKQNTTQHEADLIDPIPEAPFRIPLNFSLRFLWNTTPEMAEDTASGLFAQFPGPKGTGTDDPRVGGECIVHSAKQNRSKRRSLV
jgi:hypothetical protein